MRIRFGARCDGCGVEHNNYSVEDVYPCSNCGLDLCAICRWRTFHDVTRETCCDEPGHGVRVECPEEANLAV